MQSVDQSRSLGSLFLVIWGAGLSIVVAGLMAPHWIPQPRPSIADPEWVGRNAGEQTGWLAVHVVYEGCPCSVRVLNHLRERGPIDGVRERIVRVGEASEETNATIPGFEDEHLSPDEMKSRYGIEGVPMLLVYSPTGVPKYAGGHTPRKQSFDFRDRWIISQLMSDRTVAELPVFGCPIPQNP